MAGCLADRVEGESSFAGGGGGATISGADSPSGPRGSDAKSKSSILDTTTDWPRRELVGRRRDVSGEARFVLVVRGVDVVVKGFCCMVDRFDGGDDDPNRPEVDAVENS